MCGISEEDVYRALCKIRHWLSMNSSNLPSTTEKFVKAIKPLCFVHANADIKKLLLWLQTQQVLLINNDQVQYNNQLDIVMQSLIENFHHTAGILTFVEQQALTRILNWLNAQRHYGLPSKTDNLINACKQLSHIKTLIDPSIILNRLMQLDYISAAQFQSMSSRLQYNSNHSNSKKRQSDESAEHLNSGMLVEGTIDSDEEYRDEEETQPLHKWTRIETCSASNWNLANQFLASNLPCEQMGQV